ncbi:MAG: EAL domain-containing protein, partial [Gammaproteobacteria bacterium]|nr:EAL domain-containing protein [Gammaproteobacteria bacterium]
LSTDISFINLSGASLDDDGLFEYIREQLDEYQISPSRICFEVTETVAIANLDVTARFISRCRREGFLFALDDFGSGFCSFSYLKAIPVDYLKVDGGFVKNMLNDQIDCSIVESVNSIGHVAGLKTIAEFVESVEVMDKLRSIGVDFAQGFCIEKPEPLPEPRLRPALV